MSLCLIDWRFMDNNNIWDAIIVGAGPAGIFTAYEYIKNKPDAKILMIEKGHNIRNRRCPKNKTGTCVNCQPCNITTGFSGAGAFSDGKYNITTEFGGWLQDIRPKDEVLAYIEKADEILVKFGATTDRFMPNNELKKLCLQNDLHMLQSQCKHLGTDANFETMVNLISYLKLLRMLKYDSF